ncbi:hypothetical protein ACH5RR_037091, partial [Cinchona calisaya]
SDSRANPFEERGNDMDPNSPNMCQDEEMKDRASMDSLFPRLEYMRGILIELDWTILNPLLNDAQFFKVKHKWRSFECKKADFLSRLF